MSFLKTLYFKWFPGNTVAHRLFWKYRYLFRINILNDQEISDNITHPHRIKIIEELRKFNNVRRVLELGSSWGANLYLISQSYPNIECTGIDISKKMVDAGNRYFKSRNDLNIKLIYGDILSLKNFKDKEFDLIITDASFIYVDRNNVTKCAEEMTRISSRGLILLEFDDNNKDPLGHLFQSTWIRDYGVLFEKYSLTTSKQSFDENTWTGKWFEHGKIITVFLKE